jgi:hypothetical protein
MLLILFELITNKRKKTGNIEIIVKHGTSQTIQFSYDDCIHEFLYILTLDCLHMSRQTNLNTIVLTYLGTYLFFKNLFILFLYWRKKYTCLFSERLFMHENIEILNNFRAPHHVSPSVRFLIASLKKAEVGNSTK